MTDSLADDRSDIHTAFGLSYSNYLVLPRTLLQSMSEQWRKDFAALLGQFNGAFAHVDQAECYEVRAAIEREVSDLADEELKSIGYSKRDECDCYTETLSSGGVRCVPPVCPHETTYYDARGTEVSSDYRVAWPVDDPVPHYDRGRTHIEPRP